MWLPTSGAVWTASPAAGLRRQPQPSRLIEKSFAPLKQTGPVRQTKLPGLGKVDWLFVFSCAAHNLLRLPKLMITA